MVVVLLMGAISVNFSTTAYVVVSSDGIHEVPLTGGFKFHFNSVDLDGQSIAFHSHFLE